MGELRRPKNNQAGEPGFHILQVGSAAKNPIDRSDQL